MQDVTTQGGTETKDPGEAAMQHREGPLARALEQQTAKIPSDVWLWSAFGSMAASLTLQLMQKRAASLFVGQWAAPFLLIGVYNKLVKLGGSDRYEQGFH